MAYEITLADCMDYLKHYPDNYFDLAVVDPPYGINATSFNMGSHPNRSRTDGHGSGPGISTAVKLRKGRLNSSGGKLKNRILNQANINWDSAPPSNEYFEQLFRVSKQQVIWGGNYFNLPPTRCLICWDKKQPWDNFSQFELAWTSFDKPATMFRFSNKGGANTEKKIHPTQKPVELYKFVYNKFLPQGGRVLDTHLGSASSCLAAIAANNIHFTGFEIDPQYFNDSSKRVNLFTRQLRLNLDTPSIPKNTNN